MPQLGESATNFMMALGSTRYMFPVIGVLEVLCGLSLLTNKYTAISLLLLAPITFNILGFHLALDQGGLIISVVMTLIHLYLIYDIKDKYKPLLK
jgi:putative oxidoreductase